MRKKIKKEEGAPGFEPGTSRSAVECSTTELYPHPLVVMSSCSIYQRDTLTDRALYSLQLTSTFDVDELAVLAEMLCDVKAFLDRNMQFLTTVSADSSK